MSSYKLVARPPSAEEYRRLREEVGWGNVDEEATAEGLRGALFSVCVVHEGPTVACGRVLGDGAIYFYVQDVIVLPEHQGRGVGRLVMDSIMGYLSAHARPNARVGLMAAKGTSRFYEGYGFSERPRDAPGMNYIVK